MPKVCKESPDIFIKVSFKPLEVLLGSSDLEPVFQREQLPGWHSGMAWWAAVGMAPICAAMASLKLCLFCGWKHLPHISD